MTDYICLNMLKHQLLDVYETFSRHPDMLKSMVIKEAYSLLADADNMKKFRHWQDVMRDMGMTFDTCYGFERQNNILGILEDITSTADEETISEFVSWKRGLTPEKWQMVKQRNKQKVSSIEEAVSKIFKAHIVIFRCNGQWAAVGEDADRLFEAFGWQTGYVFDDDGPVSWMFINEYGKRVLDKSKYDVKVMDVGNQFIISTAFTEDMLSSAQQMCDYARQFVTDIDKSISFFRHDFSVLCHRAGYKERLDVGKIKMDKRNLLALLKSKGKIGLMKDDIWKTSPVSISISIASGISRNK